VALPRTANLAGDPLPLQRVFLVECGRLLCWRSKVFPMSVYRLDPINLIDPSWDLSSIKEAVWAGAKTPTAARDLVALKALRATQRPMGSPKPIPASPWYDDKLTSCVLYPDKKDIPEGTVMTLQGRSLPLTSF
jgi:hypothetical protein